MKRLVISLAFTLIGVAGVALAQPTPATSVTGYLYEAIHRNVLESVADAVIGRPVKDLDPYFRRHEGQMNNLGEVKSALARDFLSFRQPRLKVLTKEQADAWAARLEAGYIGIGAPFDAVGFSDGVVRVMSVGSDTTAEDAGIKAGDRITAIDGRPMKGVALGDIRTLLQGDVGQKRLISVLRNGVAKDILVEVDMDRQIGIEVDFDPDSLQRYFKTGKLSEDSPAYKGGLRENDLVVTFNGQSVKTLPTADFINLVRNGPMGETLTFEVLRDLKPLKIEVVRGIVAAADYGAYELSRQSGGEVSDIESNHFKFKLTNLDWNYAVKMADNAVEFIDDAPAGILDLRGSSGNELDSAVLIAARFLNDGRVLRFKVMQGQMPVEITYSLERFTVVKSVKGSVTTQTADGQSITKSIDGELEIGKVAKKYATGKMVVLIDGETSGAAEVLAAILQSQNRALVVGRKTDGMSTLVTVSNIMGVNVQVPTTKILEIQATPFKKVKPDYSSWFYSGDREAAFNALAGTPWYWSSNFLVMASVTGFMAFFLAAAAIFSRKSGKDEEKEESEDSVKFEPELSKPTTAKSSGGNLSAILLLIAIIVLFCSILWIPKILLGPPAGVTSKVVVELVVDDSELSKRQQKVFEQLKSEYSGNIEFKLLNYSDGPDVLEKSSDGFWKASVHELRPSTIWLRRIYYDASGKPIQGKWSGTGMGTFTKAWLVRSIENLSEERDAWPSTAIKRTKPVRD